MTVKETKRIVFEMKQYAKVLQTSPRRSRVFLVSAGIATQKGQLTANYRTKTCTRFSPR